MTREADDFSADDLASTISSARTFLADRASYTGEGNFATSFAIALLQVSRGCVFGVPCDRHAGAVHGQEAEELRAGVEQILRNTADVRAEDERSVLAKMRQSLTFLLDQVDARDSLAFREATDSQADEADAARRWEVVQEKLTVTMSAMHHAAKGVLDGGGDKIAAAHARLIADLSSQLVEASRLLRVFLDEDTRA